MKKSKKQRGEKEVARQISLLNVLWTEIKLVDGNQRLCLAEFNHAGSSKTAVDLSSATVYQTASFLITRSAAVVELTRRSATNLKTVLFSSEVRSGITDVIRASAAWLHYCRL